MTRGGRGAIKNERNKFLKICECFMLCIVSALNSDKNFIKNLGFFWFHFDLQKK